MKVKFLPQNVEIEIKPNQSILHLAHDNGIHIKSVCKGVPSCTECRVRIVQGEYNVLPPSAKEVSLIGNSYKVDGRRLSCQLKCFGDVSVDLTEQVEKENETTKRPRGRFYKGDDPERPESRAKLGSILLEDNKDLDMDVANFEEEPPSQRTPSGRSPAASSQSSHRSSRSSSPTSTPGSAQTHGQKTSNFRDGKNKGRSGRRG